MSNTIWVKCVKCGSDAERSAFRDYCTSKACEFSDDDTRARYYKTKTRPIDDDQTQPCYIPPSRLFAFCKDNIIRSNKTGVLFVVDRVCEKDDCYELISVTGVTYLRWPRDKAEAEFSLYNGKDAFLSAMGPIVADKNVPPNTIFGILKSADSDLVEFEIEDIPDSGRPLTCLEFAVEDWTKYPLSRDACVIDDLIKKAES